MIDEYLVDDDTAHALARGHGRRRRRHGLRHQHFLRGPIPMSWLHRASVLPGMALAVGIRVWFLVGLTGSRSVALNLSEVGFDRTSAARGLAALEAARLVQVVRGRGRKAIVTVTALNPQPGREAAIPGDGLTSAKARCH